MKTSTQRPTIRRTIAILEGQHVVETTNRSLKIGDSVRTQWGPRRVVGFQSRREVAVPQDGVDYAEHALERRTMA
jgi:hypothetical protein